MKKVTLSIEESNVLHDIRQFPGRSKHAIIETSRLSQGGINKSLQTLLNKGLIFITGTHYYKAVYEDIKIVPKDTTPKMGKFKRDSHLAGIVMFFWYQKATDFTVSEIERYLDCRGIRRSVTEILCFLNASGVLTTNDFTDIDEEIRYKWSGMIEYPFPDKREYDIDLFKLRVSGEVSHRDSNKNNNSLSNLEFVPSKTTTTTTKKPKPDEVVLGMLNMRIECLEAELVNLKAMRNVLV